MDNEPIQKRSRSGLVIAIVTIVLAGSFITYLERGSVYAELNALNLIPTPEQYTELYFNNTDSLPTHTVAGKPINFSFVIHNVEGVTTTYPYTVYLMSPSGKDTVLKNNVVTLPDGASTTIAVAYTFMASITHGTVVVDLTSLNQKIDFLLQ